MRVYSGCNLVATYNVQTLERGLEIVLESLQFGAVDREYGVFSKIGILYSGAMGMEILHISIKIETSHEMKWHGMK